MPTKNITLCRATAGSGTVLKRWHKLGQIPLFVCVALADIEGVDPHARVCQGGVVDALGDGGGDSGTTEVEMAIRLILERNVVKLLLAALAHVHISISYDHESSYVHAIKSLVERNPQEQTERQ